MSITGFFAKFFLGYAALTVALFMLSYVVPKAGFLARVLGSYISLLVVTIYGAIVSIVLTLVGQQSSAQWAAGRVFRLAMRLTTGVEFVIDDPKGVLSSTRPAVFIGNHQTELDVLMLGSMFPKHCSITAKRSLKNVPFLGWFMTLSGSIFIDRKNSRDAREAMQGAADEIKKKRQSVYMFPEGTRSYSKDAMLLPFKKGCFHLALQAEVPIVPVVVANYSHILYIKGMVFNSGRIPIKVLDPIPTKGLTPADVDELARTTRELMLRELTTLSAQAKGHPVAVPAGPAKATTSGIDTTI